MRRSMAIPILSAAAAVVCAWANAGTDEARNATWVQKRVAAWQPTDDERAFDKIGWVATLAEAQRLASAHKRPLFLFTYDGTSLGDYRC